MRVAWTLLSVAVLASAQPPAVRTGMLLKASVAGHSLILNGVYLNGSGPFRMLVDTGNATSMVRPEIARRLHLKPAYPVEHASVAQTRRLPVAVLDEVRAGSLIDRCVEAMIGDIFQPGVDGVLGATWLVRHDYLLDYANRQITLDLAPPTPGIRVPLRSADGRPVVVASIDGRSREFVVDSGASTVVLYEKPLSGAALVHLDVNGGSTRGQIFTARFSLNSGPERRLDAVRVDAAALGAALLPAGAFASVFVSNRNGFVEFSR